MMHQSIGYCNQKNTFAAFAAYHMQDINVMLRVARHRPVPYIGGPCQDDDDPAKMMMMIVPIL